MREWKSHLWTAVFLGPIPPLPQNHHPPGSYELSPDPSHSFPKHRHSLRSRRTCQRGGLGWRNRQFGHRPRHGDKLESRRHSHRERSADMGRHGSEQSFTDADEQHLACGGHRLCDQRRGDADRCAANRQRHHQSRRQRHPAGKHHDRRWRGRVLPRRWGEDGCLPSGRRRKE